MDHSGRFDHLLTVLDAGHFAAPRTWPRVSPPCPGAGRCRLPWATWTLIGLVAYGRRKRAAWAPSGGIWHPVAASLRRPAALGFVLPWPPAGPARWEADLEGSSGFLTNKATGEVLQVDLGVGPRSSHGPLRRLPDVPPAARPGGAAASGAASGRPGTAAGPGGTRAGRPAPPARRDRVPALEALWGRTAAIREFLESWETGADRPWLAALVGDWPAAHEAARAGGDPDLIALTGPRAERCRHLRLRRLRARVAKAGLTPLALHGLADVGAADLPRFLRAALRTPGDGTDAALELVAADPAYVPHVARLYRGCLGKKYPDHRLVPCTSISSPTRLSARRGRRGGMAAPRRSGTGPVAMLALGARPRARHACPAAGISAQTPSSPDGRGERWR